MPNLHKWLSNGSIAINHADCQKSDMSETEEEEASETSRLHVTDPQSDQGDAESLKHRRRKQPQHRKYTYALKTLIPIRPAQKDKTLLPANEAGFFSFVSVNWLNKHMWKAFRKGITPDDVWNLQPVDTAAINAERLERIWQQELSKLGPEKASFSRAVWHFSKTRTLVAMLLVVLTMTLQFVGPAWLMKAILTFVEEPQQPMWWGGSLLALLFVSQMLRNVFFTALWNVGFHTSTRVVGAVQCMIYKKMLRLRSGGDKLLAQVITFCTNDYERIFEAVSSGVLILGTPVMFLLCVVYSCIVLGPWALLGNLIILLFYPIMACIAHITSKIRIKTVRVTDQRVALMNEILNSVQLIKMYAWEKSFSKKITGIRNKEKKELQKAAFLQSVSAITTPSISILASVVTFLGYSLSGADFFAPEAFTIFSVFNAMQLALGTLPYAVKCVSEASICYQRIQKFLHLPEFVPASCSELPTPNHAIFIKDATFLWEITKVDFRRRKTEYERGNKELQDKNEKMERTADNQSSVTCQQVGKAQQPDSVQEESDPLGEEGDSLPNMVGNENCSESKQEAEKSDSEFQQVETLFEINLQVEKQKLIGICGSVGSGKSSLLSALIGDMCLKSGIVSVNGGMAIVPQQAWIFNDTLRQNILFGSPLVEERYKMVLEVCGLLSDLEMLAAGDKTEIGERGLNLSGGQKQRVSLARAVYADQDIYLLDDPLSAVDARVAKHIFQECIQGVLKTKTVLLVTHGAQFLERCDEIIFMKTGRIVERGSHENLMAMKGDYYHLMEFDSVRNKDQVDTEREEEGKGWKDSEVNEEFDAERGKLIHDEEHNVNELGYVIFLKYLKACGGYCIMGLVVFTLMLFALSRLFSGVWLQHWLDAGDGREDERLANATLYNFTLPRDELKGYITDNPDLWMYQLVYGMSFIIMIVIGFVKGIGIARQLLVGSSVMHDAMYQKIMRSPMSFFDTTPTGRILNRFSKDMDEMDVRVPYFFDFVFQGMMFIVTQLLIICVIYPVFIIAVVVILAMFLLLDTWLNAGVRESKKIDNLLRPPVIHHISSSMIGLSVIRTYRKQKVFQNRFLYLLNRASAGFMVFRMSNRWFTFRMDAMGGLAVTITGLIVIVTRGNVSAALSGLALASIFSTCTFLPYLMRMKSELQARFTSVERIFHYAEELEEEAPDFIPDKKPSEGWPHEGNISLIELKLRYRPGLPLVLNGITAEIFAGEKIGIVGRTGAGKTSLLTTFLRLCELESGKIIIDGVDISQIGLNDLRLAVSVIPQDPVLFKGNIRYNVDPFNEHKDEKIWEALEKAYLKQTIMKSGKQLLMTVEADGENFSVGEKQLICLARALLRKSKILLLDEATASVDIETDYLIQSTIREAFVRCTVLTIAHRLNTVANYDRIMVMDAGKVMELDTPVNLMEQEDSLFRRMMLATGVTSLKGVK